MQLQTVDIPLPVKGINLETNGIALDGDEAHWLKDVIFTEEGLMVTRGANATSTTLYSLGTSQTKSIGAFITVSSSSSLVPIAIATSGTALYAMASSARDLHINCADQRGTVTQATTKEGILLGIMTNPYTNDWTYHGLGFFRQNSILSDYGTGTITATNGATAVTGSGTSWNSNHVGKFLYIQANECSAGTRWLYAGIVQSVTSTTALVLENGSRCSATGDSYVLLGFRPFEAKFGKGRITCSTSSSAVTGFDTSFTQEATSAQWHMYRLKDHRWIGLINAVNNDTSVTLTASAAIAMNEEAFYIVSETTDPTSTGISLSGGSAIVSGLAPGVLVAAHKNRYFYGCRPGNPSNPQRNRVYFSRPNEPELLNFTDGGYYFDVGTQSGYDAVITGLASVGDVLLIFTQREVYALYGDSPANFVVKLVSSTGCVAGNSIRSYEDSVIFLSQTGIYRTDGANFVRLTAKIDTWFKANMVDFDIRNSTTANAYGYVGNDHYIIYIESFGNNTTDTYATMPSNGAFCINLKTGAITIFSNFAMVGTCNIPDASYIIYHKSGSNYYLKVGNPKTLFVQRYAETFTDLDCAKTSGTTTSGPLPVWVSRIFSFGDPYTEKYLKGITFRYNKYAGTGTPTFEIAESPTYSATTASYNLASAISTVATTKYLAMKFRSQYFWFEISLTEINIVHPFSFQIRSRRTRRN